MFFKRNKLEFQVKFTVFCSYNCKVNAELLGRSVGGPSGWLFILVLKRRTKEIKLAPKYQFAKCKAQHPSELLSSCSVDDLILKQATEAEKACIEFGGGGFNSGVKLFARKEGN